MSRPENKPEGGKPAPTVTTEPMAGAIALALRIGVTLAALVGLIGGIVYLVRHGGELPHYRVFLGEPNEFRSLPGVIDGVMTGDGRAIIQLGVMILIVVPVVRVALAVIGYARGRDGVFVGVTTLVLAILIHGLIAG